MGVSIGYRLKAIALVIGITAIVLIGTSGILPAKVDARANLTAYNTVTPNGWEPLGYNVTGTAPYYITHTLGWNNVKIMGGVGLPLNSNSNYTNGYTDNYFMAGDVSAAPWDPGRLAGAAGVAAGAASTTGTTAGNNSSAPGSTSVATGNASHTMIKIPDIDKLSFDNNASSGEESATDSSASGPAIAGTGQMSVGNKIGSMPLNDPYHSILLGRPVDDLPYEYPLAPTISAYFNLVGVPMPCGSGFAGFSMRCLGYGY